MTPRPSDDRPACGACGAPLAADQRYCLECGARHGAPLVDPLAALGFPAEAIVDSGAGDTAPAATSVPAATAPAHLWLISVPRLDASAFAAGGLFADLAARGTVLSRYAAAGPSAAANEVALLGGQVPTADCDADL